MVDSLIPVIVPISLDTGIVSSIPTPDIAQAPTLNLCESYISPTLSNSRNVVATPSLISISLGDIRIEIGSGASDNVISAIIKANIMHLGKSFGDISNRNCKKQRQLVLQDKVDAYFALVKLKYS